VYLSFGILRVRLLIHEGQTPPGPYRVYVAFMFREILDFLNENEDISRPMLSEKTLENPRIGIEKNKFYELILDIEIGKKINRDN